MDFGLFDTLLTVNFSPVTLSIDKIFLLKKLLTGLLAPTFAPTFNRRQGDVAQLVEQRTENPCVGGSIPSITTLIEAFSFEKAFFVSI